MLQSYIVYLGTHSHGLEPTSADLDRATNSHYNLLSSFVGSTEQARNSIFYSYNRFINGFAAVLEEEEAAEISKHPDVISVFLNKGRQLHTTRSWRFLGLEGDNDVPLDSAWKKARFGENTIIGNLDTGVWPESKSFSDEGLGLVPSRWRGVCQNDVKDNVTCNRKLIGARYFNKGYIEYARSVNSNFTVGYNVSTVRDLDGHGSHTLSTAGGNFVAKASVFGNGKGTVKGGSPKARVAAYKGASLSAKGLPSEKFYPLITAAAARASKATVSDATLCKPGTLDPVKVKGKILVCLRGENGRVEKGSLAAKAGAIGMILANNKESGNEILADAHFLPASHINFTDGLSVFAYINSTKTPGAYMTRVKTELNTEPSPVMASFSSRGPNVIEPSILKPDITAPGVNVIAAFSEAVGPTARIRAGSSGPMLDSNNMKATPFAYGAGHVRPNRAVDPGLVYDMTTDDYLNFLCARGYDEKIIRRLFLGKPYLCPKSFKLADFNYPTITVPNLNGSVTITRRVKNVGSPGSYNVRVKAPGRVSVTVEPKTLKFTKVGEEKTFKVTLKPMSSVKLGKYIFGDLTWSDGSHQVKSCISSYIVYLGSHSHGPNPTPLHMERATNSHHEFLASFLGSKEKAKESVFYSYNKHINGFAARLEEEHAEQIAKHPDTVSIFENKLLQLHTTRSWEFLGLEKGGDVPLESLWKKANFGEGIIIGNIDSGISPEYESFNDEGYGPVPSTWRGVCESGTNDGFKCNRKFIGARYFYAGFRKLLSDNNISLPETYFNGASLSNNSMASEKYYPVIDGVSAKLPNATDKDAMECYPEALDNTKTEGKILVCVAIAPKKENEKNPIKDTQPAEPATRPDAKPYIAKITANDNFTGNYIRAEATILPSANINFTDGQCLFDYMKTTKNPVVQVSGSKTEFNTNPAPMVAQFSSRGPNKIQPAIIKPDVTAPGVDIIAPYRPDSSFPYKALSASTKYGKSQSPILDQATKLEATTFQYGSGHVRPDLAADPGLVYELRIEDYLNFFCAHGYNEKTISTFSPGNLFACPKSFNVADFNYPSIAVPDLVDSVTITRKLLNVGTPGTYNVTVEEIAGVSVQVEPKSLKFGKEGEEQTFKVVFKRTNIVKLGKYVFGGLTWSDGSHCVRSPIAVML
ncbi:hypothetical protein Q3G72_022537 [Acer saccharum]|nr:hypothetical protein Q3G72_022537 [Acer saccharum]